jgi:hypothetical protein
MFVKASPETTPGCGSYVDQQQQQWHERCVMSICCILACMGSSELPRGLQSLRCRVLRICASSASCVLCADTAPLHAPLTRHVLHILARRLVCTVQVGALRDILADLIFSRYCFVTSTPRPEFNLVMLQLCTALCAPLCTPGCCVKPSCNSLCLDSIRRPAPSCRQGIHSAAQLSLATMCYAHAKPPSQRAATAVLQALMPPW